MKYWVAFRKEFLVISFILVLGFASCKIEEKTDEKTLTVNAVNSIMNAADTVAELNQIVEYLSENPDHPDKDLIINSFQASNPLPEDLGKALDDLLLIAKQKLSAADYEELEDAVNAYRGETNAKGVRGIGVAPGILKNPLVGVPFKNLLLGKGPQNVANQKAALDKLAEVIGKVLGGDGLGKLLPFPIGAKRMCTSCPECKKDFPGEDPVCVTDGDACTRFADYKACQTRCVEKTCPPGHSAKPYTCDDPTAPFFVRMRCLLRSPTWNCAGAPGTAKTGIIVCEKRSGAPSCSQSALNKLRMHLIWNVHCTGGKSPLVNVDPGDLVGKGIDEKRDFLCNLVHDTHECVRDALAEWEAKLVACGIDPAVVKNGFGCVHTKGAANARCGCSPQVFLPPTP